MLFVITQSMTLIHGHVHDLILEKQEQNYGMMVSLQVSHTDEQDIIINFNATQKVNVSICFNEICEETTDIMFEQFALLTYKSSDYVDGVFIKFETETQENVTIQAEQVAILSSLVGIETNQSTIYGLAVLCKRSSYKIYANTSIKVCLTADSHSDICIKSYEGQNLTIEASGFYSFTTITTSFPTAIRAYYDSELDFDVHNDVYIDIYALCAIQISITVPSETTVVLEGTDVIGAVYCTNKVQVMNGPIFQSQCQSGSLSIVISTNSSSFVPPWSFMNPDFVKAKLLVSKRLSQIVEGTEKQLINKSVVEIKAPQATNRFGTPEYLIAIQSSDFVEISDTYGISGIQCLKLIKDDPICAIQTTYDAHQVLYISGDGNVSAAKLTNLRTDVATYDTIIENQSLFYVLNTPADITLKLVIQGKDLAISYSTLNILPQASGKNVTNVNGTDIEVPLSEKPGMPIYVRVSSVTAQNLMFSVVTHQALQIESIVSRFALIANKNQSFSYQLQAERTIDAQHRLTGTSQLIVKLKHASTCKLSIFFRGSAVLDSSDTKAATFSLPIDEIYCGAVTFQAQSECNSQIELSAHPAFDLRSDVTTVLPPFPNNIHLVRNSGDAEQILSIKGDLRGDLKVTAWTKSGTVDFYTERWAHTHDQWDLLTSLAGVVFYTIETNSTIPQHISFTLQEVVEAAVGKQNKFTLRKYEHTLIRFQGQGDRFYVSGELTETRLVCIVFDVFGPPVECFNTKKTVSAKLDQKQRRVYLKIKSYTSAEQSVEVFGVFADELQTQQKLSLSQGDNFYFYNRIDMKIGLLLSAAPYLVEYQDVPEKFFDIETKIFVSDQIANRTQYNWTTTSNGSASITIGEKEDVNIIMINIFTLQALDYDISINETGSRIMKLGDSINALNNSIIVVKITGQSHIDIQRCISTLPNLSYSYYNIYRDTMQRKLSTFEKSGISRLNFDAAGTYYIVLGSGDFNVQLTLIANEITDPSDKTIWIEKENNGLFDLSIDTSFEVFDPKKVGFQVFLLNGSMNNTVCGVLMGQQINSTQIIKEKEVSLQLTDRMAPNRNYSINIIVTINNQKITYHPVWLHVGMKISSRQFTDNGIFKANLTGMWISFGIVYLIVAILGSFIIYLRCIPHKSKAEEGKLIEPLSKDIEAEQSK